MNVRIVNLKGEYDTGSESRFICPSHCYVMWCPLTTGIVASQFPSSRDAVLVTCFLKPLASAFLNAVKQFYQHQTFSNEFANLIDNCGVAFDTNDQWNHSKAVPVIGLEIMLTCACLRYIWDYLQPGICSLIKPIPVAKCISFSTKITTVML